MAFPEIVFTAAGRILLADFCRFIGGGGGGGLIISNFVNRIPPSPPYLCACYLFML